MPSATDRIVSIIPVAATVAVAGYAIKAFARPIKKSKTKLGWF